MNVLPEPLQVVSTASAGRPNIWLTRRSIASSPSRENQSPRSPPRRIERERRARLRLVQLFFQDLSFAA